MMLIKPAFFGCLLASLIAFEGSANEDNIEIGKFKVNDYALSYTCAGQGKPNVFLEAPSGISAEDAFANVFSAIAKRTRVCRYERLGFGRSDDVSAGLNQTVADYSGELKRFIELHASSDKVVLVGYSFGGFIARHFTANNREKVSGIVLIDAAHENWLQDMKETMRDDDWVKMQGILDWFLDNLGHNYWDSQFEVAKTTLPDQLEARIISRGLPHETIHQSGISEAGIKIYNDLHDKYQTAQLALTNKTSQVIARNSGHLIVDSEPEIVLKELFELID
ncbi:alpha/beta hydrolase [Idiomarina loihiensis]|uniref:alpha/beta fold hydrolase n=1 Tax=Idiomarina loihiensis TaxID=135577 RepID=UPI003158830C